MDVNGAAAIVTGGASGLGLATARDLAAHGAKVVIADLNEAQGKTVADELGGVFVKTDVSDEAQVQAAVDAAVATGAPLRVVVNSAGIGWASRTVAKDGSPHDSWFGVRLPFPAARLCAGAPAPRTRRLLARCLRERVAAPLIEIGRPARSL